MYLGIRDGSSLGNGDHLTSGNSRNGGRSLGGSSRSLRSSFRGRSLDRSLGSRSSNFFHNNVTLLYKVLAKHYQFEDSPIPLYFTVVYLPISDILIKKR